MLVDLFGAAAIGSYFLVDPLHVAGELEDDPRQVAGGLHVQGVPVDAVMAACRQLLTACR